ncbi:MAG: hypothetical protein E6J87_02460 [Deltaproteobacteria bacterium]|nr:MAG: hypothetical protein E6J87_02460 [Deltaproteobacteria bacterium]
MQRLLLVLTACLFALLVSAARACPVMTPDREALVDVEVSSIRLPLEVGVYDDPDAPWCAAGMELAPSALPSLRLVPRPRELAGELAPVAKVLGAKTCTIMVWLNGESDGAATVPSEECYVGEFRFDGASWSQVEDDRSCW